jgi:putative addiction module killer protein
MELLPAVVVHVAAIQDRDGAKLAFIMVANYGSQRYNGGEKRALRKNMAKPKRVIVYADANGKEPFTDWLYGLRDSMGRKRILARLVRLGHGNYGDCEPVGEGVSELRLFFGPGYRVYFGEDADDIVILLCGGDKGSQSQDISQAKAYWQEYLNNEKL